MAENLGHQRMVHACSAYMHKADSQQTQLPSHSPCHLATLQAEISPQWRCNTMGDHLPWGCRLDLQIIICSCSTTLANSVRISRCSGIRDGLRKVRLTLESSCGPLLLTSIPNLPSEGWPQYSFKQGDIEVMCKALCPEPELSLDCCRVWILYVLLCLPSFGPGCISNVSAGGSTM